MAKHSSWRTALVTGASVGIGKEIAEQLAAAGSNLVLVARDRKRLEQQAKAYSKQYGIKVEVLALDLMDPSQLKQAEARAGSTTEPIDLLVNNAGMGTNGLFHELPIDGEQREIELNVVALSRLTHAALAQMVPSRQGAILNISSISALMPGPRMATYAATKAFVSSFSESLHLELRDTGVTVTVVHPGFTKTEFQLRAGMADKVADVPSRMWMTAGQVAEYALAAARKGRVFYAPGWYDAFASLLSVIPRSLKRSLSTNMKQ